MHATLKLLENQGLLKQKGDRVNNMPWCPGFGTVRCREQVRQRGRTDPGSCRRGQHTDHRALREGNGTLLNEQRGVIRQWFLLQLSLLNAELSDTALAHSLVSQQEMLADESQMNPAQVLTALSSTCFFSLMTLVQKQAL